MDYVVGLSKSLQNNNIIWAILDRFTKSIHFLPMPKMNTLEKLIETCVDNTVSLHRLPIKHSIESSPKICISILASISKRDGKRSEIENGVSPAN